MKIFILILSLMISGCSLPTITRGTINKTTIPEIQKPERPLLLKWEYVIPNENTYRGLDLESFNNLQYNLKALMLYIDSLEKALAEANKLRN